MEIVITLIVVFIISFILIYIFVHKGNSQEPIEEKIGLFLEIIVAVLFSLIITVTFGLLLFVLLGSTSVVNMIFSLNISTNQLIVLTISFFVYLFILDSLIEFIVKYIIGSNMYYVIVLTLIRICVFYVIGILNGLDQIVSFTTAVGVAFITLLLEYLYQLREKNKQEKRHPM